MYKLAFATAVGAFLVSSPGFAADTNAAAPSSGAAAATDQTSAPAVDGEVRKVDKDAKKITLKHGEIKNLGMPGMTMVFQVKDPAMLDKVQAGDKVRFSAENVNGALTVTQIEPVK